MIPEASCDTEDWSKDNIGTNYILKYIKIEDCYCKL